MNLLFIFGGASYEHEISIESAKNLYFYIDKNKYNIYIIYLDRNNDMYLLNEKNFINFSKISNYKNNKKCYFNTQNKQKLLIDNNQINIDLAIPIIHGDTGEDGTFQGLLDFLKIPYLSSNTLSMVLTYNKKYMKDIMIQNNLPTNNYILIKNTKKLKKKYKFIKNKFKKPFFIKPSSSGSSLGVFKINNFKEFKKNIKVSFQYSNEILAEKTIYGKELEIYCFKIENKIYTTKIGEMITKDFYDFESKYINTTKAINNIPANINKDEAKFVKKISKKVYKLFNCRGLVRIDLFITKTNKILINEINSIPGYVNIINRNTLIKASNYSYTKLFDILVQECIKN